MTPMLSCDLAMQLYESDPLWCARHRGYGCGCKRAPWARLLRASGRWVVAWANGPQPRPTYHREYATRREARDALRTLKRSRGAFS